MADEPSHEITVESIAEIRKKQFQTILNEIENVKKPKNCKVETIDGLIKFIWADDNGFIMKYVKVPEELNIYLHDTGSKLILKFQDDPASVHAGKATKNYRKRGKRYRENGGMQEIAKNKCLIDDCTLNFVNKILKQMKFKN